MTVSASSVLFIVLAVVAAVATVFIVKLVRQLTRTAAEAERLVRTLNVQLVPRIERVLEQAEGEMVEVRAVTRAASGIVTSADRIIDSVGNVVVQAQETVNPILQAVGDIGTYARQGAAVLAGVKAGLVSLKRPRYRDTEEAEWGI